MFCYKVVDDCVIERSFRKKCSTDSELEKIILETVGATTVLTGESFLTDTYSDLYTACKELTCVADTLAEYEWFVSVDNKYILALAILKVFDVNRLWSVMQSEEDFNNWVKDKVR